MKNKLKELVWFIKFFIWSIGITDIINRVDKELNEKTPNKKTSDDRSSPN